MATEPRRPLRETRERQLVAATRALFDERGMQDAPVEEIARSVGIARGLIYRQFSSKAELFVLTVTDYLSQLGDELDAAAAGEDPHERLERVARAFLDFCSRYPAFLDCALSLMRRPAQEWRGEVSESVLRRLGACMATCVGPFVDVIADGARSGAFAAVEDPATTANVMWTQCVGAMHLARVGVGLQRRADGAPALFAIDEADLRETLVAAAFAQVGARRAS